LYCVLAAVNIVLLVFASVNAHDHWFKSSQILKHPAKYNMFFWTWDILGSILGFIGALMCALLTNRGERSHCFFPHLLLWLSGFLISSMCGTFINAIHAGGDFTANEKTEFAFALICQFIWFAACLLGGLPGPGGYHGSMVPGLGFSLQASKNRSMLVFVLLMAFNIISLITNIVYLSEKGNPHWVLTYPIIGGILGILAGLGGVWVVHSGKTGGREATVITFLLLTGLFFTSIGARLEEFGIFTYRLVKSITGRSAPGNLASAFAFLIISVFFFIASALLGGLSSPLDYQPI